MRAGAFVRRQPDEVWGWVLVVAGLLSALGIHLDLLGYAGHELRRAGSSSLGWGEDVLPGALLAGGISLIAGRARRGIGGVVVSLVVLAVAAGGLADLAAGGPSVHEPLHVLGGAGGVVGSVVGSGLRSFLGVVGASILLSACVLGAGSALVGVPLRAVAVGAGRSLAACWRVGASLTERRDAAGSPAPAGATTQPAVPARSVVAGRSPVALGAFDDDLDAFDERAGDRASGGRRSRGDAGDDLVRSGFVAVDGIAVDGIAVDGVAVDGVALDGIAGEHDPAVPGREGIAGPSGAIARGAAAAGERAPGGSGETAEAARRPVAAAGMVGEGADGTGDLAGAPGGIEQLSLGILPSGTPWRLPPGKLLKRSQGPGLSTGRRSRSAAGCSSGRSPPTAWRPTSSATPSGRR